MFFQEINSLQNHFFLWKIISLQVYIMQKRDIRMKQLQNVVRKFDKNFTNWYQNRQNRIEIQDFHQGFVKNLKIVWISHQVYADRI